MNNEFDCIFVRVYSNGQKQPFDPTKIIYVKPRIVFRFIGKNERNVEKAFLPAMYQFTLSNLIVSLNAHMTLEYQTPHTILVEGVEISHDQNTTYITSKRYQSNVIRMAERVEYNRQMDAITSKLNNINIEF